MKHMTLFNANKFDKTGVLATYIKDKKPIPHIVALSYFPDYRTHHPVFFYCKICGGYYCRPWIKLIRRQYGSREPICGRCIVRYINQLPETRKNRSRIMKERYKDPVLLDKHRQKSLILWKEHPELFKNSIKYGIRGRQRLFELHPELIRGGNGVCGEYNFRNKAWVKFDSSWELRYLIFIETDNELNEIRRCEYVIPYDDGEGHVRNYHLDFLEIRGDKKIAIEIKGSRGKTLNNLELKTKSAIEFFGSMNIEYKLLLEDWLRENIALFSRRTPSIVRQYLSYGKIKLGTDKLREKYGQN